MLFAGFLLSVSERSQASQKESDRGTLDQSFTIGRQPFITMDQELISDQPARSALNMPPIALGLETSFGPGLANGSTIFQLPHSIRVIAWPGYHFGFPRQLICPLSSTNLFFSSDMPLEYV